MFSLRVYIARHCPASIYSIELVRRVARSFPQADVRIVDVDDAQAVSEQERQAVLFTPGYFLNGRPIFWGNPPWEDLLRRLCQNDGAHAPGE